MGSRHRVGSWATTSLVLAAVLVLTGLTLERTHVIPFWGGLIMAFGEAALVGGLADWFAVRALFTHPLGIRLFPHTALIPRNRRRIVREICNLVENQWLPKEMLRARIDAFDFVGQGLMPLVATLKPTLPEVLRTVALDLLRDVEPERLAAFLSQVSGSSIPRDKVVPFLADLLQRLRDETWLRTLMRELIRRLKVWADSPRCRAVILDHLQRAAQEYKQRDLVKRFTTWLAQVSGGLDLETAAGVLQLQLQRFAETQGEEQSDLNMLVRDALADLEQRLRADPAFGRRVEDWVVQVRDSELLHGVLASVVAALKTEGLRILDGLDSEVLHWAVQRLQDWLDRLAADPETQAWVNDWCRRKAAALLEQHHGLIGLLVREQLDRLSDERLTTMIEEKVGEDLNWIRINGAVVGGAVGVALYLVNTLLTVLVLRS
jgi:uncharacterized membrane-anchored protein YjiN (DUF445 family)